MTSSAARMTPTRRYFERRAEARRRTFELQVRRRCDAVGRRRETEEAKNEPLRQRVEERAVLGAELLLDERAPRLAVSIRDRHAARIVEQDAEKILLRHRGFENQRRPHETEQKRRDHRET